MRDTGVEKGFSLLLIWRDLQDRMKRVNKFKDFLAFEVTRNVIDIVAPSLEPCIDVVAWNVTSDGNITMKYAYINWPAAARIGSFLWKLGHEKVLTNERQTRMGIRCQNNVESLLHLFRVCQEIKLLWQFFIRVESGGNFYVCDNWEQWMLENLSKYHLVHGVQWNLLFGIILNIIFKNWPVVEVINTLLENMLSTLIIYDFQHRFLNRC
ncbi:putative ribonuclease H protein [Glycine soja]